MAEETQSLCIDIGKSGELAHLTGERIWLELTKVLNTSTPWKFFEFLKDINCFKVIFPELVSLKKSHFSNMNRDIAFANLVLSIPLEQVETLCLRLRTPNYTKKLAIKSNKLKKKILIAQSLEPEEILVLLKEIDAFRKTSFFKDVLKVCSTGDFLVQCKQAIDEIDIQGIIGGLEKSKIPSAIIEAQVSIICGLILSNK